MVNGLNAIGTDAERFAQHRLALLVDSSNLIVALAIPIALEAVCRDELFVDALAIPVEVVAQEFQVLRIEEDVAEIIDHEHELLLVGHVDGKILRALGQLGSHLGPGHRSLSGGRRNFREALGVHIGLRCHDLKALNIAIGHATHPETDGLCLAVQLGREQPVVACVGRLGHVHQHLIAGVRTQLRGGKSKRDGIEHLEGERLAGVGIAYRRAVARREDTRIDAVNIQSCPTSHAIDDERGIAIEVVSDAYIACRQIRSLPVQRELVVNVGSTDGGWCRIDGHLINHVATGAIIGLVAISIANDAHLEDVVLLVGDECRYIEYDVGRLASSNTDAILLVGKDSILEELNRIVGSCLTAYVLNVSHHIHAAARDDVGRHVDGCAEVGIVVFTNGDGIKSDVAESRTRASADEGDVDEVGRGKLVEAYLHLAPSRLSGEFRIVDALNGPQLVGIAIGNNTDGDGRGLTRNGVVVELEQRVLGRADVNLARGYHARLSGCIGFEDGTATVVVDRNSVGQSNGTARSLLVPKFVGLGIGKRLIERQRIRRAHNHGVGVSIVAATRRTLCRDAVVQIVLLGLRDSLTEGRTCAVLTFDVRVVVLDVIGDLLRIDVTSMNARCRGSPLQTCLPA